MVLLEHQAGGWRGWGGGGEVGLGSTGNWDEGDIQAWTGKTGGRLLVSDYNAQGKWMPLELRLGSVYRAPRDTAFSTLAKKTQGRSRAVQPPEQEGQQGTSGREAKEL